MNYAWVETAVMALIFFSATLFAIKHFLPGFYGSAWRLRARKNSRSSDISLAGATSVSSCQTKCSSCNACSMASK
jgi:hypothetical protein